MVVFPFLECIGGTSKRQHKPTAFERELLPELLSADIVAAIDILAKVLGADVIASRGGAAPQKAIAIRLFLLLAVTKHATALLGDDRDG